MLLQGEHNMCAYGQCRNVLSDMAIMDGPNMLYLGYGFEQSPGAQPQQFVSGVGFIYQSR